MVHIGEYTVIVPEEYEQSLLDAEEQGHLDPIENAADEFEVVEIIEDAIKIDGFFVTVIYEGGSNGHK